TRVSLGTRDPNPHPAVRRRGGRRATSLRAPRARVRDLRARAVPRAARPLPSRPGAGDSPAPWVVMAPACRHPSAEPPPETDGAVEHSTPTEDTGTPTGSDPTGDTAAQDTGHSGTVTEPEPVTCRVLTEIFDDNHDGTLNWRYTYDYDENGRLIWMLEE